MILTYCASPRVLVMLIHEHTTTYCYWVLSAHWTLQERLLTTGYYLPLQDTTHCYWMLQERALWRTVFRFIGISNEVNIRHPSSYPAIHPSSCPSIPDSALAVCVWSV